VVPVGEGLGLRAGAGGQKPRYSRYNGESAT
jgi:hypothetical protein